jgi:hypothetical protein
VFYKIGEMGIEFLAQFTPIIGTILYAAFGYAKAQAGNSPEGFDGVKFARALSIGVVANVATVVAGLPIEQSLGIVPLATVLIDQIASALAKRTGQKAVEKFIAENPEVQKALGIVE